MEQDWTRFWDMSSGGSQKLDWKLIYIQAPYEEAIRVFYARFNRNPYRVTCTCCGPDYSVDGPGSPFSEGCNPHEDMDCKFMESYFKEKVGDRGGVLLIPAGEITDDERKGPDPEPEGFVWV